MKPSAAIILVLALSASGSAQSLAAGDGCTLYHRDGAAVPGPYVAPVAIDAARRASGVTRVVTQASARFEVDYSGFTAEAQAAFQVAVDIWANHVTSPVPIRVSAEFAALDENVLGSAGPNLTANFANAPQQDVFYPLALADALAGRDLNPDQGAFFYDIISTFSSANTDFYFGLDGNVPDDQIDFVTIVLHELGHGLGFIGSGDRDDGAGSAECEGEAGTGCWGYFESEGSTQFFAALAFDTLIEDAAGQSFTDRAAYPNPGDALGDLLQSENLFINAPATVRVYGDRVPVWAPAEFERGSSFSHWDEVVIRNSSAALMTPSIRRGEAYQDPGDITCGLFRDLGWSLGPGCRLLTDDGLGPVETDLVLSGPNPTRSETSFRVRLETATQARVRLVDALGREVATLFDGLARDGTRVAVDVRSLASGVYYVSLDLGTQRLTRSITVAR